MHIQFQPINYNLKKWRVPLKLPNCNSMLSRLFKAAQHEAASNLSSFFFPPAWVYESTWSFKLSRATLHSSSKNTRKIKHFLLWSNHTYQTSYTFINETKNCISKFKKALYITLNLIINSFFTQEPDITAHICSYTERSPCTEETKYPYS